jgi:hypothetical protein
VETRQPAFRSSFAFEQPSSHRVPLLQASAFLPHPLSRDRWSNIESIKVPRNFFSESACNAWFDTMTDMSIGTGDGECLPE